VFHILEKFLFIPEFIKKGMNTATIEITLRNTGRYSYKKSQYGDRIIVTRIISNAACGYKMKTEQGIELSFLYFSFHIYTNVVCCLLA
jgi:hypothetical protein